MDVGWVSQARQGCGNDTVSSTDCTVWWVNLSTAADAPSPLHTFPALGHALLGQRLQPLVLLVSLSMFLWLRAHKSWQAS